MLVIYSLVSNPLVSGKCLKFILALLSYSRSSKKGVLSKEDKRNGKQDIKDFYAGLEL